MFKLVFLLAVSTTLAQDDHAGHDHGSADKKYGWEWVGAFDLHEVAESTGTMSLILQQKNGKYAANSCNILVLKTTSADAAGIEASEESAKKLFKDTSKFTHVEAENASTTTIVPGKVYKLEVDKSKTSTTFTIGSITEGSDHKANYVLFSEHALSEFEGESGHFLKTKPNGGADIEPKATEPSHESHGNTATTTGLSAAVATLLFVAAAFTGML